MWIAHLVDELFFDGRNYYPTARAFVFCNYETTIRRCFYNWETHVGKIGDATPLILAVASRTLRATLDDVTRDRAGSHLVPIVGGPAKLVHERRSGCTSVGGPARDHYLRPTIQRLEHRRRAQVNVRALNLIAHGRERLAGIHI